MAVAVVVGGGGCEVGDVAEAAVAAALPAAPVAGVPGDLPDPQPEPRGRLRRGAAGQEDHQGESE